MLQIQEFYLRVPIRHRMVRGVKIHPIHTNWFLNKFEEMGESMHSLAPRVRGHRGPMTYSNFRRMIHGEFMMTVYQVEDLSRLLKVPMETICRKALGKP